MADFKLGRIKFKWRGDWAVDTAFLIDDVVKYGGNTYVCIQNHTSPANQNLFYTSPGTYTAYWSLNSEALFFKGTYANSTWYKLNDLVKYGQRQYRCTTAHTSSSTVLDSSKFELYLDALDYKGDYATSTYYKVNDVVRYGGSQYKCTTAHTSSGSAGAFDETKFTEFTEGFQFEDTWSNSTVYQEGDVVNYGGYSYVAKRENSNATPGTATSDWDTLTTGFTVVGDFTYGNTYKTGEVVRYGGNTYVAQANGNNQYPANTNGTTNTTYFELVAKGFNYRAAYSNSTTYNIGDVVRLTSTTYVAIQDRILNVSPDSDGAKWQVVAQGDSGAVLSTRGDLLIQDASQSTRLPIGTVGSVLTTDGTDPSWSAPEGANVKYVANSGSDSNPGSQYLPYKTLYYALSQATSGDVVSFDTITGGTGGTPGTYDITQTSSDGSGTGVTARVVLDGSSTPTVTLTSGGSGHAADDVITFTNASSQLGGASSITITVVSASIGDIVYVKNGVYRETLPIRVPAGVTVQGESLRGTEIRPAGGQGHQVKTVTTSTTLAGATEGTYSYKQASTTNGSGTGFTANVVIQADGTFASIAIYNGGSGYVVGNTITFSVADLGCGGSGTLIVTVASLENNEASNMWLMNNTTNLFMMSFKGLTGIPGAGATGKAAVVSLDPSGSITTTSPYIQNCTSSNQNATGVQIDGLLHTAGNKSILANDFTQINSDGKGVHAIGGGRGEMVSVFTYYCDKSFHAESGGFIRALNCSSAYGEQGAVSDGTLASETPITVAARGQMLVYNSTTFVGDATESDIANCITTSGQGTATIVGATSGATASIFRVNISLDYLHIENVSGTFQQGETVTVTKEDSSTFQFALSSSFGDSSAANQGQIGPLIALRGSFSATAIKVGTNLKFTGINKYYRISLVSEQSASYDPPGAINATGIATVRLTESVTTSNYLTLGLAGTVTEDYTNIRLTGHDFLSIGTGDIATSNYPGGPSQAADQSDEVSETNGGRVYWTSTDQIGDFRVGDLFRIQQSTGIATLNADAFDLSGLSELQLGSIGAELGATINEFSTDQTLSGNANTAVPTENAVYGHLHEGFAGTDAFRLPAGTTAQRPGSPAAGMLRYNTDIALHEQYVSGAWEKIDTKTTGKSIALAMIFG